MCNLADLRICFLAGTLDQGGAERQLYYIVQSLRNAGAEVTILTLMRGEYWESRLAELGASVHYVGAHRSRFRRMIEISRKVRSIRPDVVHSQHFYTNIYAAVAARMSRAREIGSIRSDVLHELSEHSRPLGLASLRFPRTLAINSQRGLQNAISLGVPSRRTFYLPNVVDTDRFVDGDKQPSDHVQLCWVGRIVQMKRIDILLRAMQMVRTQSPYSLKATIVGDGPERASLESLAHELGLLPECVEFVGSVDNPLPYYQHADVVVLTSDWEGTPNVLLEAMSSGKPVVATAVGDVPELVKHGENGLIASVGDAQCLADCLLEVCRSTDSRRAMGNNARRFVVENHGKALLANWLGNLYSTALA